MVSDDESSDSDDNNYIPNHDLSSIKSEEHVLFSSYPTPENLSAAHTLGRVVLDNKMNFEDLVKILCDTGALSANYIAKDLLRKIEPKLGSFSKFKAKCRVTLADSRTVKDITEGVKLRLVLKDQDAKKYAYSGDFFVLDMKNNDVILGLPALTGKLYPFMMKLMEQAHGSMNEDSTVSEPCATSTYPHQDEENSVSELHNTYSTYTDSECETDDEQEICLINPWSNGEDKAAPEDEETELPVNFGDALTFLGKPREEALGDYKALLDSHISPYFKENTDIMNYCKQEDVMKVFVPDEWSGIKGIPPLKVEWKDTLPAFMKPPARPINPRLWEASEKEFRRLCGYFYGASRSPWASCLVVAPKATAPFIRFCGDYVKINKHMKVGHYTIPNVKHELTKIINFPFYLDIDLTNAFHQILLDKDTAEKLSIQTPWGQYEPKFMPEGIAPATGILQETVRKIFKECEDWAIVIFDNMLILAENEQDGFEKFKRIVEISQKHNLKLKMAKSWLGFKEVNFFGYVCKHKSYQVSPDKKEALGLLQFPTDVKKARTLLGKGVFFSGFTPKYSDLVAHLPDMTKKTFNWDKKTWKHDYEQEFAHFVQGLQEACDLFYPDYNLDWILRTDASELGVGAVLLQKHISTTGEETLQPIAFVSKKFSDAATRWSTIEQEAYGIYYAANKLSYYLVGKEFVLETDHNNLLWMEASMVPKVIRWRIYLQAFNFLIRHISGKSNVIADWMSRIHHMHLANLYDNPASPQDLKKVKKQFSAIEALQSVHNSKVGHMGERQTWTRLNNEFPGHGIPFQRVAEFVSACPCCNKTRLGMHGLLTPVIRTLKPPDKRTAIGIDAVEITPHGKEGHTHINVIVNLFTKFVSLHPVKGCTALNLANSVWKHWCWCGHTDMVISDQGPDLTSELFAHLTTYMGMSHTFSIANRHANGCERSIGEVVRHLRAMAYDASERQANHDVFADPSWIDSVMHIMNSTVSSETGHTPFELTYGSEAMEYMSMAKGTLEPNVHVRLAKLNADLIDLKVSSQIFQKELVSKRKHKGIDPLKQNLYQPGDFVFFDKGPKVHPKMFHRYLGPYEVTRQVSNDVTCKHMATGEAKKFDVFDLSICTSPREEAFAMACRDQDQHIIESIVSVRGDLSKRSTLLFKVKLQDGDVKDIPYSKDLFDSIPYEDFCCSRPYTLHLAKTDAEAKVFLRDLTRKPLTGYEVGDEIYLDIRFFGNDWFMDLQLPDQELMTYVSRFVVDSVTRKHLRISNAIYVGTRQLRIHDIYCYVHKTFLPESMVLIDEAFSLQYPKVCIP